jgi:hypothetical protein
MHGPHPKPRLELLKASDAQETIPLNLQAPQVAHARHGRATEHGSSANEFRFSLISSSTDVRLLTRRDIAQARPGRSFPALNGA